ncbi:MarR family transcriptional regulator [Pendulispora rubella]|uniref:MarR family transcriptional regulator n=1 Tax=Pendulispora rubella TaxID=2741070 RepID=A0ABZ2LC64_9BACT
MATQYGAAPRAVLAFITLSIVLDELAEAEAIHFRRHGLSQSRFVLLILLMKAKGQQLTPLEIASGLGVRPATVTGLVAGLEREGLVERRPDTADRRVVLVHLQPKGRSVLENMLPDHLGRISKLCEGLSDADLESLTRTLTLVRDRLDVFRDP